MGWLGISLTGLCRPLHRPFVRIRRTRTQLLISDTANGNQESFSSNSTCWLDRVTWLCQLKLYRTRFDFSGFIMNCILSLVILLSRHQLTSYLSRSHCPFLSSIKRKYRLKYYFLQASCNILNFHWYDPFLWKFQTIAINSFFLFKFTKLPLSATRNLSTITSLITSHRENHCIHFVLEQT